MIRFLRSLPLHFRSAVQGIFRHSATAFSAISAVTVTLVLMAVFMLLTGNIDNFTRNVEDDFKIHATIDSVQSESDITSLQKEIEAFPEVKTIEFSSKETELEILIEQNSDMFSMYRENNPMPNAFVIEVTQANQIDAVNEKLNALTGIEKAQYGGDVVTAMIRSFESIRNGGMIFVASLSLLAIFLISNTIRMTIFARQNEISIMRSVGANNWFIRTPFVFEGMFIGILGSIIPVALTYFGYQYLYDMLQGVFLSSMFVMKPLQPFASDICLLLLGCGVAVGMVGSFLAASKYLRWKR